MTKKNHGEMFDPTVDHVPLFIYPDDVGGDWPKRTPDTMADLGISIEEITGSNPDSASDSGRENQG